MKWAFLAVLIVGSLSIWWSSVRLKRVRVDGKTLYVSNFRKEIAVPLGIVERVSENRWINIHPMTLYLRGPTDFGDKIVFMPKTRGRGMIDPDRHMNAFRLWPPLLIFGVAANGAYAAEPMTGRWAQDAAACSGGMEKPLLIVSDTALRWGDDDCRIGAQYRTSDTLHLEAFCLGAHGKRTIPISLRPAGDRIFVTWNRAARGQLRRCPTESKP